MKFPVKYEQFTLDIALLIVPSDNFPQDAAATVSTMEAAAASERAWTDPFGSRARGGGCCDVARIALKL